MYRGQELAPLRTFLYVCTFEGCALPHVAKGYCGQHHRQLLQGKPLTELLPRVRSPRGEYHTNVHGYRLRRKMRNGAMVSEYEHRDVMQEKLGRPLRDGENVHHINGDRADNRPENLELWSSWQPQGQRVADKIAWVKQLLAQYEPAALR